MLGFLARRVVIAIPTIILISIFVFSLQKLLPGDPILVMAGEERDPEVIATLLSDQSAGDYTASQIGWSGRVDPDGNIHQFMTTGGGINDSKYSNPDMDKALNKARLSTDAAVRKQSYNAAVALQQRDMPIVYLYHPVWIWALKNNVSGFVAYPDGMIRLHGVSMSQ